MVREGETGPSPPSGLAQLAAVTTAFVGGWAVFFAGAHLFGVIVTATRGRYPAYEFRFAALLFVGMTLGYRGPCVHHRRCADLPALGALPGAEPSSGRVFTCSCPHESSPSCPELAGSIALLATLNLVALLGAKLAHSS